MKRLPSLKAAVVLKTFQKAGFAIHHIKGSHYTLRRLDDLTCRIVIYHHRRELSSGTLRDIIKQARMTEEQFLDLL